MSATDHRLQTVHEFLWVRIGGKAGRLKPARNSDPDPRELLFSSLPPSSSLNSFSTQWNGYGAQLHFGAVVSENNIWRAVAADETIYVVHLEHAYFSNDMRNELMLGVEPCGCKRTGLGCTVYGNPLGALHISCDAHMVSKTRALLQYSAPLRRLLPNLSLHPSGALHSARTPIAPPAIFRPLPPHLTRSRHPTSPPPEILYANFTPTPSPEVLPLPLSSDEGENTPSYADDREEETVEPWEPRGTVGLPISTECTMNDG
ncbi:hypothetical protein C8R44DRAFT_745084 [Mycena epipterygia]|nr:hypothetical protein C8R44DRAFT_745084 [Mycena epipterygia]